MQMGQLSNRTLCEWICTLQTHDLACMLCDRCKECGAANKYEPHSGHTKSGWCPVRQRFAEGLARRRLQDLHETPRTLSVDACAFIEHVRSGGYIEVRRELELKPELILMHVPAAPAHQVAADPQARPKWTWSVLHEAIRQCDHSPDDRSMETVRVLLAHCAKLKIKINTTIPQSSNTWATPLHQACWRGSRPAIQALLDAGADPFAETAGGNLPIHNTCRRSAPAYTEPTIVLWMLDQMISHHGDEEWVCRLLIDVTPEGLRSRYGYDEGRLPYYVAIKLGTMPHSIRGDVRAHRDRHPQVSYLDLDDPAMGDALFL